MFTLYTENVFMSIWEGVGGRGTSVYVTVFVVPNLNPQP
jgi:hypothetical protein